MHVFPGGAKASLVCKLSLESIAKTFKEHPKAPTPRRRVSAQFDISLRMVLHKSNQKHSLSYHQGLAYLNDVEASGQTYPPLNHWTNRTAAFPAFQLTSEATANCLQQSEASSRNDAKELQNAKSRCLKTTLHFLCTQNLAQALSSWFHWHFLLKLVQLSCCWSHGQILRQGSRDITKQNRSEKKSVSIGTTVRSKQSERCERTAERKSGCLKTTLGFLCTQNFVQTLSSWFHSQFLLALVQLSSYSTSESNITRQNCSEKKWVSMRTTVRSKQSEPCARTAEREVWLLENNLALFVHSKPCASFVLLISLTLFTHTRTTLMMLKSWTNSSTRESGHHQTKPLWKEIGLNGDNNPKQAVMRKNCGTRSLAVWKQPCTFCVLKTLLKLCPPDFIHTFYSHSYNSQAIRQVSRTSPDKTAPKRNGCHEDNSPKQAVGTMRKNCRTRSLAVWKQPCTFCVLKTLRKLCRLDFIHTFYSHSYNSQAVEVMDKFFDKGVGTSPAKNCSEKKSVSMGTTVRSKQSCERTAEREVSLLENNLGLFVYSKHCSNFVLLISFTLFTHTRTTLKLFDKWVEHHQTKLVWKEMGVNEDNSPKQAVGTMHKNCGTRSLAAWKQPCTFCVLKKPCANFVLLISFTLFTHTRTTLKLFDKWVEHHQTKLLRKEMGINEEPGCFALLPLSKESSSISQVKEAWRCGFVMLCAQRSFAFGMILPEEHIWQLVLATAPADWSWGLVLATGFLGKVLFLATGFLGTGLCPMLFS